MGQGRLSEQYDTPIFARLFFSFAKRPPHDAEQEIDTLRRALFMARKESHVALQKFNQAWDAERKAQAALVAAEDRRGELSESIVASFSNPA